jgi:hypothetical protein
LSLIGFLFFTQTRAWGRRKKTRVTFTSVSFLLPFNIRLPITTTMGVKKKKKRLTEFQVLSFSNEWLTASLTAVE